MVVDEKKFEDTNAKKPAKKASPSAGIFGFAGATRFQPGQSEFDAEKAAVPFKPKDAD